MPPWGFPRGAVVENLPANAGDTGSSPSLGRSHMPRSNWAREPQLLSLRVWSLYSATREAAIVRGPRLPQLGKALAQKQRPNTAKKKKKKANFLLIKNNQLEILMKMIKKCNLKQLNNSQQIHTKTYANLMTEIIKIY